MNSLEKFLRSLERKRIAHSLNRVRDETIMVIVDIPGERWEVEFFVDGHVEAECFRSDGEMFDESILRTILKRGT